MDTHRRKQGGCVAYLGARLTEPVAPGWRGGPFWRLFKDKYGRVRDPALWEPIVAKRGDEGTLESLRKRNQSNSQITNLPLRGSFLGVT